jgi:hypothetical protein
MMTGSRRCSDRKRVALEQRFDPIQPLRVVQWHRVSMAHYRINALAQ